MKNIFLLLSLFISLACNAQEDLISTSAETFSQLWSTSTTYTGITKATLGTQRNTTQSSTVYLTSSVWNGSTTAPAFKASPVPGSLGAISFIFAAYHASLVTTTNAVCTVTPEASYDSLIWAPIPGVTVATVTVTPAYSVTPITTKFDLTTKPERYVRLKVVTTTDTARFAGWYYFQAPYVISK